MRSVMGGLLGGVRLWGAAWRQLGDQWRADLRVAAAAILDEEAGQIAHGVELRPVDDGSALALGVDQPSAAEDGQMRRHGVVRHRHMLGDLASRKSVRLVLHEEPEHVEARGLGERSEGENGLF